MQPRSRLKKRSYNYRYAGKQERFLSAINSGEHALLSCNRLQFIPRRITLTTLLKIKLPVRKLGSLLRVCSLATQHGYDGITDFPWAFALEHTGCMFNTFSPG